MPTGTLGSDDNSTDTTALVPSGSEDYSRNEAERAQRDLASRALQYAKGCGATVSWPPPSDLESVLRSDFWFFIFNAGVHRHAFEGPAHRVEENKRKLSELVKTMLPLLELLRNESHTRALGALVFENWLVHRFSAEGAISGEAVGERIRQCLELLLGPLEHAFDRSKGTKGGAPHGDRNRLIRWANDQAENSGGWWPANPTDEDLTVLSILTGVYLQNFEDDFDNREELAEELGSSGSTSQLNALWRKERKRCSEARKNTL